MISNQDKLFEKIKHILQEKGGIKAKEIARHLGTTKKEVNSVLYGNKYQKHFRRDMLFRWNLTAYGLNTLQGSSSNREREKKNNAAETIMKNLQEVDSKDRRQTKEERNKIKYNNYELKVGQKLKVKEKPDQWVIIESFGEDTIRVYYFNRKTEETVELERPISCIGKTLIVDKNLEMQTQEDPTIDGPSFIQGVHSQSRSKYDGKNRKNYEGTGYENDSTEYR